MQYRGDDTFFDRDGQGNVNLRVVTNAFGRPTGIHPGMLCEHARDQGDEQIGERRFDAVRSFHFHCEAPVRLEQTAGIRIARHEKVRNGCPTLGGARSHEPPDRPQLLDLAGNGLRLAWRGNRCDSRGAW